MHCDNYTEDPDYVDCDIDDRVSLTRLRAILGSSTVQ